jgi:hypothetical protein
VTTSEFEKHHPTEPAIFVGEDEPDTVATPEGDNEFQPDQPLPASTPVPERPRGNEPHPSQPIRPAQE